MGESPCVHPSPSVVGRRLAPPHFTKGLFWPRRMTGAGSAGAGRDRVVSEFENDRKRRKVLVYFPADFFFFFSLWFSASVKVGDE